MKKIVMLSVPRSGSNHIGVMLAKFFQVKYYMELLTDTMKTRTKQQVADSLNGLSEPHVAKHMGHNFFDFDYNKIHWANYDHIIFTERKNIARACISTYVSTKTGQWSITDRANLKPIEPFVIDDEFIIGFKRGLKLYNDIKQDLISRFNNTITIHYEDIKDQFYLDLLIPVTGRRLTNEEASTFLVASERDYDKLCLNVDRVQELLKTE